MNAVKILLKYNVGIDYKDTDGYSAFDIAVINDNTSATEILLPKYVSTLNTPNRQGITILETAYIHECKNTPDFLIKNGATKWSGLPVTLYIAALNDDLDSVEKELKMGTDPNAIGDPVKGRIPLHAAIIKGHTRIINALLECKKIDVTIADKDGYTSLHFAVQHDRSPIDEKLVLMGAKTDAVANDTKTPYDILAKRSNNLSLLSFFNVKSKLIFSATTYVNELNGFGESLLALASQDNLLEDVKTLIKQGANKTINDENPNNGNTALKLAARNGHALVVDCLLANGAKDTNDSKSKQSSLYAAANNGHTEVVKKFVKHNAEVSLTDGFDQWTPLHIAIYRGHHLVVDALLEAKDIDTAINQPDKKGLTPLHIAAKHGRLLIADKLIKKHAKTDAKTNDGKTASDLGNDDMKKIIASAAEQKKIKTHSLS